jgi:hypothetical protein
MRVASVRRVPKTLSLEEAASAGVDCIAASRRIEAAALECGETVFLTPHPRICGEDYRAAPIEVPYGHSSRRKAVVGAAGSLVLRPHN